MKLEPEMTEAGRRAGCSAGREHVIPAREHSIINNIVNGEICIATVTCERVSHVIEFYREGEGNREEGRRERKRYAYREEYKNTEKERIEKTGWR